MTRYLPQNTKNTREVQAEQTVQQNSNITSNNAKQLTHMNSISTYVTHGYTCQTVASIIISSFPTELRTYYRPYCHTRDERTTN